MDKNYELDPDTIVQAMQDMIEKIEKKNTEYKNLGIAKAGVNRMFNRLFAKHQLMLKNKGMATTILKAQTLGLDNVSMAYFNVEAKEAEYAACREALHSMSEIIGTYRSFLTWLRMEYKGQNVPKFHS